MKRLWLSGCLLFATLAALAARPLGTWAAAPEPDNVVFYHWWTSSSELAALNALVETFKSQHAGATVTAPTLQHGGGVNLFAAVRSAAYAGKPPDAVQVHAGAALRPYFDAGLLRPVDHVWASEGLAKVVPPMVRTMSQIDGHYYAVPVDVHRTNLIWYNKAVLDKHRIDPLTLTTWDAFFAAAEKLRSEGVADPVQIGVSWTASHLFECVMASQGAEAYETWVNGKITAADDPRLREAFQIVGRVITYANKDQADTDWDAALRRVVVGESAFSFMGDWADGEFRIAGKTYGKDYGAVPVPGTKTMYGVAIDTFVQPRGKNRVHSDEWLKLAASAKGQDAFNVVKGSISPRSDTDATRYDVYQRSAIADFKAAKIIYPSVGCATHDAFRTRLNEIMAAFVAHPDVAKAAAALAAEALRSEKQFKHVWVLK